MSESVWLKAHAMVDVKTGIVTAVNVTESNTNDCPDLPGLLDTTAKTGLPRVQVGRGCLRRRGDSQISGAWNVSLLWEVS